MTGREELKDLIREVLIQDFAFSSNAAGPHPRAKCPSCGQVKAVRRNGAMWAHDTLVGGQRLACAGGRPEGAR